MHSSCTHARGAKGFSQERKKKKENPFLSRCYRLRRLRFEMARQVAHRQPTTSIVNLNEEQIRERVFTYLQQLVIRRCNICSTSTVYERVHTYVSIPYVSLLLLATAAALFLFSWICLWFILWIVWTIFIVLVYNSSSTYTSTRYQVVVFSSNGRSSRPSTTTACI